MRADSALVYSGGGAWGAYELGVTKALFDGKVAAVPVFDPEILTGTSIGSFNAAYLVSNWDARGRDALEDLEALWFSEIARNACGNGAFRIRFNPLTLFNPMCFMAEPAKIMGEFAQDISYVGGDALRRASNFASSNEPLAIKVLDLFNLSTFVAVSPWERLIEENINFNHLPEASKGLRIATTDWIKGYARVFERHELNQMLGPKVIRASSAIPGFFEPERVGNELFVDGGVLMNTPLKPAIGLGAQVLHVINMTPPLSALPYQAVSSTFETLYRQQLIAWSFDLHKDIDRVFSYNKAIELLQVLAQGQDLTHPDLEVQLRKGLESLRVSGINAEFKDLVVARSLQGKQSERIQKGEAAKNYKLIEVHRYFPMKPLGDMLSLFDLRPGEIENFIARGYEDACNHDCHHSGCVLVDD